jgi:hypothetical protein
MTDFNAQLYTTPSMIAAFEDPHDAVMWNTGGAKITHYKLRAHRTSDDTWQYWIDTSISISQAPGGSINYDAASLTVESSF